MNIVGTNVYDRQICEKNATKYSVLHILSIPNVISLCTYAGSNFFLNMFS